MKKKDFIYKKKKNAEHLTKISPQMMVRIYHNTSIIRKLTQYWSENRHEPPFCPILSLFITLTVPLLVGKLHVSILLQ